MELSARQFAQLVNHLKGPTRFGGPADQRRAARVEQQSRLTIVPLVDGHARPEEVVRVKNLSAGGLGFVRDRAMRRGSKFLVTLSRSGQAPVELPCTVARCEKVEKGFYFVGAEFTSDPAATALPAAPSEAAA